LNQEINFIPDFGAATNGIASTVTWELEGTIPLASANNGLLGGRIKSTPSFDIVDSQ
jgi:hypothetical protein